MTAEQLIEAATTCVTCRKVHKPFQAGNFTNWAGKDGHPYRTRMVEMTGDSHSGAIRALRLLAAEGTTRSLR